MPGVSDNVNGHKEVCERQLFSSQEYPYESHTQILGDTCSLTATEPHNLDSR